MSSHHDSTLCRRFKSTKQKKHLQCFTCLEFWFSIRVLTSGCSVKSGAKYSKYSAKIEDEDTKRRRGGFSDQSSSGITELQTHSEGKTLTAVRQLIADGFVQQQRGLKGPGRRTEAAVITGLVAFNTMCVCENRDVCEQDTYQQRATFLTVYPPPPSTSSGILKLFTNSTHSLRGRARHIHINM